MVGSAGHTSQALPPALRALSGPSPCPPRPLPVPCPPGPQHLGEPGLLLAVPLVGRAVGRVHVGEGVGGGLALALSLAAAALGVVLLLELQLPVELLVAVLAAHPEPRRDRGGTEEA